MAEVDKLQEGLWLTMEKHVDLLEGHVCDLERRVIELERKLDILTDNTHQAQEQATEALNLGRGLDLRGKSHDT